MNSDYKSALDKIHLEQNKKEEMKMLFRKGNMKRKSNYFKAAVAVAACMALVVGVSQVGSLTAEKTKSHNSFSIQVNADTLEKGNAALKDTKGFAATLCGDKGNVKYSVEFPVSCKGTNIDKITYSIKGAVFQVSNTSSDNIIMAGKKVSAPLNLPGAVAGASNNKDEEFYVNQYKSFTVDYNKQNSKETCISIAYDSKRLSEGQRNIIKNIDVFSEKSTLEDEMNLYKQLYKNVEIKCVVTYKDKTTETKTIKASSKMEKASATNEMTNNPKGDDDMVYTVYSLK